MSLPINLADPRLTESKTKKKKQFPFDVWNSRVKKWGQWAADLGMHVEFEYWGNHEIWNRLMKDEHRGRMFWFEKQWFSDEWLRGRIEEAHNSAAKRHQPQVHVALDLEHAFEAVGATDKFFSRIADSLGCISREFDHVGSHSFRQTAERQVLQGLGQVLQELVCALDSTRLV